MTVEEKKTKEPSWKKWGPYLSERQWGTVREDYSEHGSAWDFFPHDHARSRVYRWGEDGIAGISDDMQRLCFSIALWNHKDPILKERLFGLTGPQGNHGEDVKELYYYLDNTPSHSYMKHLYKYPIGEFPYQELVDVNAALSKEENEFELINSGAFDDSNYFDVFTEFAKEDEEDILIKITIHNRSSQAAPITLLPQIWFRNLWSFGLMDAKPSINSEKASKGYSNVSLQHSELGDYYYYFETPAHTLFTENESNNELLWQGENDSPFVKDLFHTAVVNNEIDNYKANNSGTKFSPIFQRVVDAKKSVEIRVRLSKEKFTKNPLLKTFDKTFSDRIEEANDFYASVISKKSTADQTNVQRQAFAGMLWSKQYYNIDVPLWLNGDAGQPAPPVARKNGRNSQWPTLNNEDIISMPDKWEYPWYAAWDLAFHCIPLSMVDADFAKSQLLLFLREWYMHPNGQMPAYEWAFGDVNPPVHAMSCLKVYEIEKRKTGTGDIDFLKKAFQKLCLNFTWWVNRKDSNGKNVFEGGFLGLDNIGVFDRSSAIPGGGHLEQADGTSWMAMYCLNMLEMALEITKVDSSYEPMTTKFFEHFALIAESLNRIGKDWTGAWDEEEGFFYDVLALPNHEYVPLKVRSLVGLTTLFATLCIDKKSMEASPEFVYRMNWFNGYLKKHKDYTIVEEMMDDRILLSLIPKARLQRLLHAMLDEGEFLSDYGIRALSKIHEHGYAVNIDGSEFGLSYEPAESSSGLFGGNSNWRGPIWLPMNYMLIESLRKLHQYYGDELMVECPTGSGHFMNLDSVAQEISQRLSKIFLLDKDDNRPVNGLTPLLYKDENFKNLVLSYEYFHGDNGRGVGASHQTGWTGVIAELINDFK
ncbi:MAG: MGH1-like glycoside hydrolase domain-containing protein [Ferruginibacter sp.]